MFISTADARHHLDLWRHIASRLDGTLVRPVFGLLSAAAWINGDGTLANLTLDRAHRTPGADTYSLYQLLRKILDAGLPPTIWPSIRADLTQAFQDPNQHRS